MVKISLVTPNYNYGHFLEATLKSVLDQAYPSLEYIVLDDGSTDGSMGILEKYGPQLSHWETGANRGQYRVVTDGLNRSTGEVMGWLNSDDMHLPWTLRAVGEIFEAFPEVEWISTLQTGLWDYHGLGYKFVPMVGFSLNAFLDGLYFQDGSAMPEGIWAGTNWQGPIQQESTFWRRSLWEKAGGFVSNEFGSAGDFELWARFFSHAELYGVEIPLAGFRLQHQQQSAQEDKYRNFSNLILKKARERNGWNSSLERHEFLRNKNRFAMRIAKNIAPGHFERWWQKNAYQAKKIVRTKPNSPNAGWAVEKYQF